jgi:hypothetical protein
VNCSLRYEEFHNPWLFVNGELSVVLIYSPFKKDLF